MKKYKIRIISQSKVDVEISAPNPEIAIKNAIADYGEDEIIYIECDKY